MKKPEKIQLKYLVVALAVCLLGISISLLTSRIEESRYAELQFAAAMRMKNAEAYLKEVILDLGIAIEPEDLNQTGLLGPEFTELTSTPGSVDAKRTSLNPNFAAAMIRYFKEAGLKSGDTVAIGSSGSFPGLLIAAVTAATEMNLNTRVIASCGSSMHGATRPGFCIFDVLKHLKEGGFADFELLAVSPGGANDQGGSVLEDILYFGTKELAFELCERTGVEILDYDDIAKNIQRRLELYGDDIGLFINIGGASPNCGTSSYTLNFPQGLVLDPPPIPTTPYRGLSYEFAARGIPVLNLLNVRLLAQENGIAYDPIPMEEPGAGGAYTVVEYNQGIVVATIGICVAVLILGGAAVRSKRKKYE